MSTRQKIALLIVIAIGALPGASGAATVYLDNSSGVVNGCQTYDPAARSCGGGSEKAYTDVFDASQALNDGDTLYIREGEYWSDATGETGLGWQWGSLHLQADNVSIENYNGELVWVKGGASRTSPANHPNNAIDIGGDNVTIDGIKVYGSIIVSGSTNTLIQNCDLSGGFDHQSPWNAGQPDAAWPNVLRFMDSVNAVVRNCYIHDNVEPPQGGNDGNMAAIMHEHDVNTIIENNRFENLVANVAYIKYQPGYPGTSGPGTQATYRFNWMGSQTSGLTGAPGDSGKDNYVYQNVFIGSVRGGFSPEGMSGNFYVYNNTFYNVGMAISEWRTWAHAQQFFNNIVYNDEAGNYNTYHEADVHDFYLDYNNYYASGATASWYHNYRVRATALATWKSYIGQDLNSVDSNPNFRNTSGSFSHPDDFKRSSYPTNGRGGAWPSVMGAYLTGNEIIGPKEN